MQDFTTRILSYFAQPDATPIRPKELAHEIGVGKKEFGAFKAAIEALLAEGRLSQGKNKQLRAKAAAGLLLGTIKRTNNGFGYFRPHDPTQLDPDESLYIGPEDLKDAFTGDEVHVQLLKRRMRGKRCGRVVEVLQRSSSTFVGTYFEKRNHGFVRIEGGQFESAISVGDPGAKGARPDDQVVVEILRFPSTTDMGEAVITKVLGPRGTPGVDLLTVIHEFGLPDDFPEAVLEEARLQAHQFAVEEGRDSNREPRDQSEPEPLNPDHQSGSAIRGEGTGDEDSSDVIVSGPQPTTFAPRPSPRLDLTNETIITIDPVDARDFDDAISLTRDERGNWRLGVHIADVAHFVRPGTLLDKEARNRGTSVYLPDKVIPMLPEVISNALASLQAGKVRYTKSAFITFSPEGMPLHAEFANSKISVTQRFAYEQVMPLIDGSKSEGQRPSDDRDAVSTTLVPSPPSSRERVRVRGPSDAEAAIAEESRSIEESGESSVDQRTPHPNPLPSKATGEGTGQDVEPRVLKLLHDMHILAMILRARRFQRGALDLALPEVKIDMDADGKVTGAHVVSHDQSHQIIEEFMLAANIAVATKLADCGLDFLRRTHAPPDERKLTALSEFVGSLGFKIRQMPGRGDLQKLLREVHGTQYEYAVSYAVLRSTKRAEYNPDPDIGHYALSEENYCHFTSPIRRYPDLTVHRLLDEVIKSGAGASESGRRRPDKKKRQKGDRHDDAPQLPADLVSLGKWCSATERRAADAENELVKLKMLEYLVDRIGLEMDATITGVEKFGIFCQGIELPAEGLIHVNSLPDDHYDYDKQSHTLVGRRRGQVFRLGGQVRVRVAEVDLTNRKLELKLVATTNKPAPKPPPFEDSKRPHKRRRR
jgi:ribonuclease R